MEEKTNYIPGVCNINHAEIRKRRISAYFSLMIIAFGLATFIALQASWYYFLVLFIPAFVGTLGFLQARHKFCATYGTIGKHHADDDSDIEIIEDAQARKADQLRARMILLQAFVVASFVTTLCCFIPLFY